MTRNEWQQHFPLIISSTILFLLCQPSSYFVAASNAALLATNSPINDKVPDRKGTGSDWFIHVMSLPYNSLYISIYRKDALPIDNSTQFYYSPAFILDPSQGQILQNPLTYEFTLEFPIILWSDHICATIQTALSTHFGKHFFPTNFQMLPIKSIRFDTTTASIGNIQVDNKWNLNPNRMSTFPFILSCSSNQTCTLLRQRIQQNPQFFRWILIRSSLKDQKTIKKRITITTEHATTPIVVATLLETYTEAETIFLHPTEATNLIKEIVENAILSEVTDNNELLNPGQSMIITRRLETILKLKNTSTSSFSHETWSCVFWNNDTSRRPDVVTQALNELYGSVDPGLKHIMKQEIISANTTNPQSEISILASSVISTSSLSGEEKDTLKNVLLEAKEVVQWNGEKFIPKTIQLTGINLAVLKNSGSILDVSVGVVPATGDFSSNINILNSAQFIPEMIYWNNNLTMEQFVKLYNESLRSNQIVAAQGPVGAKGDQGLNGRDGLIGPTGLPGAVGQQGVQGLPGPAGSPCVPLPVPERPLIDSTTIVEAQGWNISFNANAIHTGMTLPDSRNSRDCLENCLLRNETGCRLVSFNLDTRKCIGFTVAVDGIFRPTNASMSLLTVSRKQFTAKVGVHVSDGSYIYSAGGSNHVANDVNIYTEAQCVMLCHLHPRCTAAYSFRDSYSAALTSNSNCVLCASSKSFGTNANYVSYIS